ncbi:BQ2448_4597 [Microbotryum intermedium]|uniref:BQ2448_4597 protein n=1 Tax=Microbotryum intermedium TaxID=269621 RepID=A0A238FIS5_9BASI|nr:BQ2448_4597 [Microbotryum intermedium]
MPAPLGRLRALLIDLSGTIHVSNQPTPNAAQAIQRLRKAGIVLRWVSNTSKESTVRQLVEADILKPFYLLSPSALSDFPTPSSSTSLQDLDSVIVGLSPTSFDYPTLNKAFRLLAGEKDPSTSSSSSSEAEQKKKSSTHKPPRLIATHRALYVRDKDGALSLGPGGFVTALEESSGVKAEVVGKPERKFFELALDSLAKEGINPDAWSQVGMVGDDYRQDTGLVVQQLGLHRFLVQTGKYRPGDEERLAASDAQNSNPEWCGESFEKVVDWVLEDEQI